MPQWMIIYHLHTIIGGYSTLVVKVVAQKKKKSGAKITISICLKDNRPKGGLGGCWQLEDIGIYIKLEK